MLGSGGMDTALEDKQEISVSSAAQIKALWPLRKGSQRQTEQVNSVKTWKITLGVSRRDMLCQTYDHSSFWKVAFLL